MITHWNAAVDVAGLTTRHQQNQRWTANKRMLNDKPSTPELEARWQVTWLWLGRIRDKADPSPFIKSSRYSCFRVLNNWVRSGQWPWVWSARETTFTLTPVRDYKSGYPYAGYSKDEFAYIPMAAVHTDRSSVPVRFSARILLLLIYREHRKDMTQFSRQKLRTTLGYRW